MCGKNIGTCSSIKVCFVELYLTSFDTSSRKGKIQLIANRDTLVLEN